MLSQLTIHNIAVIEKASLDLDAGFTVLSGETGAGKSIIIDALNAALGERTSKDLIRTGADRADASALFTEVSDDILAVAADLGIPLEEDGALLLRRELKSNGKTICKINGMPVTVSMLKSIGALLVGMHGQHESDELLSETTHLLYVDAFIGIDKLLQEYRISFHKVKSLQQQLAQLETDESQKNRKIDLLNYQIEELKAANITIGEHERLLAQRDSIKNREFIASTIEMAKLQLTGDEHTTGAISSLRTVSDTLDKASEFLPQFGQAAAKIREAAYLTEDAELMLRSLDTEFDPSQLDELELRLDELYRLGLKYGETETEMLDFLADCEAQLLDINFSDEKRREIEFAYEAEKTNAIALAKKISAKRSAGAVEFTNKVKKELQFLNMRGTELSVDIKRVPLNANGCDRLQFFISANMGEPPKPMSKIASGGELSRIMLAVKTVLAGKDKIETLIFDEIDTGISGDAGNKVGEKLREVSKNRQVICITHLAQIAALADHHYAIRKRIDGERTYTIVEHLSQEGRVHELARIIGGSEPSQLRLEMAQEMLQNRAYNN